MELKKIYQTLDVEVICFTEQDIVRTSLESSSDNNDGEWEID